MEIDDLKKYWEEGFVPAVRESNIAEIILKGKQSPLTMVEKKTKFAIWIFAFAGLLFAGTFYEQPEARHSLVMWLLFVILFTEFAFSIFNLVIVRKIQNSQGNIRQNVLNRLHVLRKGLKLFLTIYISLYAFLVVLLEISMYYHADILFEAWHHSSFVIRAIVYSLVLAFIYHAKRSSQQEQYSNYVEQLGKIIRQID